MKRYAVSILRLDSIAVSVPVELIGTLQVYYQLAAHCMVASGCVESLMATASEVRDRDSAVFLSTSPRAARGKNDN